jgi:hypothetical protein
MAQHFSKIYRDPIVLNIIFSKIFIMPNLFKINFLLKWLGDKIFII